MWELKYDNQPQKFLEKVDLITKKRILKHLEKIRNNPTSSGKALTSKFKGLWRYRVGDYRIICDIRNKEMIILVIKINHRSEIYK